MCFGIFASFTAGFLEPSVGEHWQGSLGGLEGERGTNVEVTKIANPWGVFMMLLLQINYSIN